MPRTVARRALTTTAPSWAIISILNSCVADFWPYRNRKSWCSDSTLASLGRPSALARGLAAFCLRRWESVCHAGLKACSTLADDGIHPADSLQETDRRGAGIFESLGWGNNPIVLKPRSLRHALSRIRSCALRSG